MKKKFFTVALALIGIFGAYCAISKRTVSPQTTTAMSIFADYIDPAQASTAVIEEVLKTIHAECDHIFMNKRLWLECINNLDHEEFSTQWDMYDTHKGLLYLKHKTAPDNIGIRINAFTLISNPCDAATCEAIADDLWPEKMHELFDLAHWQQYHNNPNTQIIVYMNGHGSKRANDIDLEYGCGITPTSLGKVLTFLHDNLKVTLLGVQSCYWTTERLYELLKGIGYQTLQFTILTPLSSEQKLWLAKNEAYLEYIDQCYCFFDCCMDFSENYKHEINEEIKQIVNYADSLRIVAQNENQQATLLAAGSQNVITI